MLKSSQCQLLQMQIIKVQVSADAGISWDTLDTFAMDTTDTEHQYAEYSIAYYATADTQIRFISRGQVGAEIYIDNVQVEYQFASPYREIVHAKLGPELDGQGVTVAVIDSGISPHVDFGGQQAYFPHRSKYMIFGDYDTPEDQYAHGTHVAGIIGANGKASAGEYMGSLPGSTWST